MDRKNIDINTSAGDITKALEKGAFLTTKCGDKVNTMVIGWGHVGRIWERPVFIAYVRDNRYTYEMLGKNPEFTVNIPVNGFDKKAFAVCGSKSGRDMDKISEAGLTVVEPEVISVPAIKEFPLTLECRVLFRQEQDSSKLPDDIRRRFYSADTHEHTAFYAEIVSAYLLD